MFYIPETAALQSDGLFCASFPGEERVSRKRFWGYASVHELKPASDRHDLTYQNARTGLQ